MLIKINFDWTQKEWEENGFEGSIYGIEGFKMGFNKKYTDNYYILWVYLNGILYTKPRTLELIKWKVQKKIFEYVHLDRDDPIAEIHIPDHLIQ